MFSPKSVAQPKGMKRACMALDASGIFPGQQLLKRFPTSNTTNSV